MNRVLFRRFPALLLALLLSDAALAVVWIAHDPVHPVPGEVVKIRLMEGDPFENPARGRRLEPTARLQHLWKEGRSNLDEDERTGEVRILPGAPGVQLLSYTSAPVEHEGTIRTHYAKALIVVGDAAAASPLRWSELGQRLEIVPQSDPVQLLHGSGEFEVQVLWEREPLAGVTVEALLRGGARDAVQAAETDEIGVVRFDLEKQGAWVIRVEHHANSDDGPVLVSATLTLIARDAG